MDTNKVSSDRRDFIKIAGSVGAATILATQGGTVFAQGTEKAEPAVGTTYTYATQTSWGAITEWHPAPDLSFSFDSGTGSPPASLSGRDQQGNSLSISFASDMSTFFGYAQRYNEGPIAYRGTRK
jgi:OAA-family lectin sugar binding domain